MKLVYERSGTGRIIPMIVDDFQDQVNREKYKNDHGANPRVQTFIIPLSDEQLTLAELVIAFPLDLSHQPTLNELIHASIYGKKA